MNSIIKGSQQKYQKYQFDPPAVYRNGIILTNLILYFSIISKVIPQI